MELALIVIGALVGLLLAPVFLMGALIINVGMRLKKNMGPHGDQSAFWSNFIAFIWGWAEQAVALAEALPFFQNDLTENFDIRPNDGRIS